MRTVLVSLALLSLIITSCRKLQMTTPVDVGRLADTYAELLVLNERYTLAKDSLSSQRYVAAYQEILRSHNLTKEEYASQFETVVCDASLYRDVCDRALKRLQSMRTGSGAPGMPGRL